MKRKHAWNVPENVTIEKIQEIRERITQWAIRVVLLMILLIVGIILIALGDDTKRIGKYVVTIAYLLMMLGVVYMAYLRNIQIKCWAKYQQIHRMDNLPIDDVREYLAQAGFKAGKADFGQMTDEEFQKFLDAHRI